MTGVNTLKKICVDFEAGGLYEYPLEYEDFEVTIKDSATLRIHNKLVSQFNKIQTVFIIEDAWGNEFFLELEKKVKHGGNDDLIEFGEDFTQAILKNAKLTSIWFKQEFNQPTLYIFLKKINNHMQSGGVVF